MQDLVKQMETMQREYQLERQSLRAQLLAVLQSQEVVPDLPLAALYSIPDASKYAYSQWLQGREKNTMNFATT